jgi:Phage tail assembly chaperone
MAKLQLGKAPENFKRNLEFTNLQGVKSTIEFDFIYRTRKQYGELMDEITTEVKGKKSDDDKSKTYAATIADVDKREADALLKIATGWDLEEPYNAENLSLLIDSFQGSQQIIFDAYRAACLEGRLKN